MDIAPGLKRLEEIPSGIDRAALIGELKKNNAAVYDSLKAETLNGWYPGKGRELTASLSEYRDREIGRVIEFSGGCPEGIAVVAVGGYGRGELSPFSDIDILLLHRSNAPIEAFARDFLYTLWDLNYHLGSSTRTVENVLEQASGDETFLTSVFESRFLCGDKRLFEEMNAAVRRLVARMRKTYLKNKFDESYGILEGSGSELLLKEPNLKKSPGGLRSVHLMEWLNFAFNGEKSFEGLRKLLPPKTAKRLFIAHDFILHLRNILHFINGRKEDTLYLDWHLRVAEYLGMKGDEQSRMARLMRHYYEKAEEIYLTLLYVLDELNSRMNGKIRSLNGKGEPFVFGGRYYVPETVVPSAENALGILLECVGGGNRMTYSLVRYLKRSSFGVTASLRNSEKVFFCLRDILETDRAYEALNIMKISGFLYRLLPFYSQIKHKVLYNPFHRYTVDQHSVETIGELEHLVRDELDPVRDKKLVHFQEIARKYGKSSWVLKLALLLHDAGKALPGDHARNGVEIATAYLKKQPLYRSYIQAIQFLIKNHLLLSVTVRRSDISRSDVLSELSRELFFTTFPEEYMDFLYLMTYADVSATNPKNFTGYLSDMLTHVYLRVTDIMKKREKGDYRADLIKEILEGGEVGGAEGLNRFLETLGESYYLTKSPEEVLDDYRTLEVIDGDHYLIKVHLFNDYIKVKFFMPDRIGLFATFCGILFLNGSDIAKAEIFTYRGIALDEFTITRVFGVEIGDKSKKEQVRVWKEDLEKLYGLYRNDKDGLEKRIREFKKNIRRLDRIFAIEEEISLQERNGASNGNALYQLSVSCTDRPALLYDISRTLSERGVDIIGAIIDTTGWYVRDVFSIRAAKNTDTEALKKGLMETIGDWLS